MAAIRDAVAGGNADKLRAAAHTLKGSSSSLGARTLADLSADLEAPGPQRVGGGRGGPARPAGRRVHPRLPGAGACAARGGQ